IDVVEFSRHRTIELREAVLLFAVRVQGKTSADCSVLCGSPSCKDESQSRATKAEEVAHAKASRRNWMTLRHSAERGPQRHAPNPRWSRQRGHHGNLQLRAGSTRSPQRE